MTTNAKQSSVETRPKDALINTHTRTCRLPRTNHRTNSTVRDVFIDIRPRREAVLIALNGRDVNEAFFLPSRMIGIS